MKAPTTLVALVLALGCEDPEPGRVCSELTTPDRFALGEPAPHPWDPTLREREADLLASTVQRRALGWRTVANVLEPIEIASAATPTETVPRFQTWMDSDELRRIEAVLGDAPTEDELDAAFAANQRAVLEAEAWPAERLAAYLESLSEEERRHGAGGISRVVYDARAARHVLRSRVRRRACMADAIDLTDPGPEAPAPHTERYVLDECNAQTLGPFYVRAGGSLEASAPENVEVTIRPDAVCTANVCTSTEPGPVWIDARVTDGEPAELSVVYDRDEPWAPCLEGGFPDGAAILKLDYRRVGFGIELPAYDTDAEALRALIDGEWASTRIAEPGPEEIFTVLLPSDARYRLAAMHIMTKELDHWVWTSLWWSDTPDTDFGADRPPELTGVWASYKMCVATHFVASRDEPTGFASLDEALRAVGTDGMSWCSNPYLEEGPGNARTNCVGCHQHAGTGLTSESILQRVDHGNRLERANFPTDYLWSNPI